MGSPGLLTVMIIAVDRPSRLAAISIFKRYDCFQFIVRDAEWESTTTTVALSGSCAMYALISCCSPPNCNVLSVASFGVGDSRRPSATTRLGHYSVSSTRIIFEY